MSMLTLDHQESTAEIAAHADAALRAVRVVLGVLSCFVLGAYRPLTGTQSLGSLAITITIIIMSVIALNWMGKRASGHSAWPAITQALDVSAVVLLALVLDEPLGMQSWILLVIPVVSAAVRHGAAATVLSWVGGCAGYLLAGLSGAVQSSNETTLLARIPGTLLAVAIAVGLLAKWMREGWEIQNELTATVMGRERRLAVIEKTGHALKNLPTQEALEMCANQMLALGFDAATVEFVDTPKQPFAVGRGDLIARNPTPGQIPPSAPAVTVWMEHDIVRVHSVSVYEPQARVVVTAWSERAIDSDHAQAVATLVAHTSAAIETETLLGQLRHASSHDTLTGLANRRSLDEQLRRLSGEAGHVSVAFIDLDDFKQINDVHGHQRGDDVLVTIARRLEAAVGSRGLVSRYGGDEFVILFPDTDHDRATAIGDELLRAVANPIALGPLNLAAGLSIGLACCRTPVSAATVVAAADSAVYQAKAAGKGTVAVVDMDAPAPTVVPTTTLGAAARETTPAP